MVAAIGLGHSGATVTSVTIGGVSASQVVNSDNGANHAAIWLAAVPTGTSGDVTITSSGGAPGVIDCTVSLYSLIGNSSATPSATATGTNSTTIAVPSNGATIGVGFTTNGSASATWTGLSKDTDINVVGSVTSSMASLSNQAPNASLSVSVSTYSSSPALAVATWGP